MASKPTTEELLFRIQRLEDRMGRLEEIQTATNQLARLSSQIIELVLHPSIKSLVEAQHEVRELQDARLRAETSLRTLRWVGALGGTLLSLAFGWLAVR